MAPLVFRPPGGLSVGWAAVCAGGRRPAREIATREPAARSGRSRGPPWPCRRPPAPRPGPEARPCPPGPPAPSTPAAPGVLMVLRVGSKPGQVPPPPMGTAAMPSGPSGVLHTGNAWSADVRLGASPRSPARPCRRPWAPQPDPPAPAALFIVVVPGIFSNFARNSLATCSNFEFVSLELQRFREVSKNDRDKLRAKFVWRWPCEPVLALPAGRSLHRGRFLRFLRRASHWRCLECCRG